MLRVNCIYILFFPLFCCSQNIINQSWHNIEFSYRPLKKIKISLDNSVRYSFDSGRAQYERYFYNISVSRKHNDFLQYSAGYRRLVVHDDDVPWNSLRKNRYYLDFLFKRQTGNRFDISFRTRFQSQTDPEFVSGQNIETNNVKKIRNKGKLVYDLKNKKIDIFMSLESFYIVGEDF